jgi:hypothetical protein
MSISAHLKTSGRNTRRGTMESKRLRVWVIPVIVAFGLVLVSATGRAQDSRPPVALDKTYPVTLGQMIATSATTFLQTLKPVDAPMMAIYNGKKIEIWVLGVRSSADGAQETLENFQQKGWPPMVAMIQGLYGVKLQEQQVVVVYRNREDDIKEVVRRENGRYIVK